MRNLGYTIITVLALGLGYTLALLAPLTTDNGTIHVTGEAEVKRVPDMATVSIRVEQTAVSSTEALDGATAATAAVIAVLHEAGVEDGDINTTGLQFYPVYARLLMGGQDTSRIEGYTATNGVNVTLRDLEKLGGVLADAVAGGANRIDSLSFGLIDATSASDEARRLAAEDAIKRAGIYAAANGATLGDLISLNEMGAPMYRMEVAAMVADMGGGAADVPVAPGEISFSASVDATFAIAGRAAPTP